MGFKYKRPLKTGDIFVRYYPRNIIQARCLCLCDGDKTRRRTNKTLEFKFKCLVLYSTWAWAYPENTKVDIWLSRGDFDPNAILDRRVGFVIEHSLPPETKENNQKESS